MDCVSQLNYNRKRKWKGKLWKKKKEATGEREREDGTLCCCLHATIRASEYNNIRISIPKYLFKKKVGEKLVFQHRKFL